ncbi:MAG TPA: acetyl-CoA C-acetyltransferase [Candidatus Obscuribacterales bacterium]
MAKEVVILSGARTPFGAYGGGLINESATNLATVATKGALARANVDPGQVDYVVLGNVCQTSRDAIYMGRHVALKSGMKMQTPALIVNQLCGSGVQAVVQAANLINTDQAEVVVAGGAEALSMTPYINWGIRWGARMGHMEMWDGLDIRDTLPNASMGETAENLREKFKIDRQAQDQLALESQQKAKAAIEAGRLAEEIVPVETKDKKGKPAVVSKDEHPRPDSTLEALGSLKPFFRKDGTVTAGNASGIVDGGSALVITTAERAGKLGVKPLSRLVSWAVAGVPPEIMGIGPVEAVPLALKKAGLKLEDMDLIEINEAFAVQYLVVEGELKLDRSKVNVNGGAIAIGHPFGATGGRLLLSISLELQRRKARYGLVSLCIGGGMGIAMIVERVS